MPDTDAWMQPTEAQCQQARDNIELSSTPMVLCIPLVVLDTNLVNIDEILRVVSSFLPLKDSFRGCCHLSSSNFRRRVKTLRAVREHWQEITRDLEYKEYIFRRGSPMWVNLLMWILVSWVQSRLFHRKELLFQPGSYGLQMPCSLCLWGFGSQLKKMIGILLWEMLLLSPDCRIGHPCQAVSALSTEHKALRTWERNKCRDQLQEPKQLQFLAMHLIVVQFVGSILLLLKLASGVASFHMVVDWHTVVRSYPVAQLLLTNFAWCWASWCQRTSSVVSSVQGAHDRLYLASTCTYLA